MNELIKQIWDKAAMLEPDSSWEGQTRFMEKFAELIVEEMYNFMCKATDNDGAWPSVKEVKQHFGVEE